MKHYALLLLLGCLFQMTLLPSSVSAQDLSEDSSFFQSKAKEYQRWLDQTGLGMALAVKEVKLIKEGSELELHLRLRPTDLDSAVGLWRRIKTDFQIATEQSLEEKLFNVFAKKMEIPPAQGNVQIYVFDKKGNYIPCFYVPIWEENGVVKSEEVIGECKDKPIDIRFKPQQIRQTIKGKTTIVERQLTADEVFDRAIQFLRYKYGRSECYERYPEIVEELRTETLLKVSVTDLCLVVLTDEQKSLWCKSMEALGWKCNDVRRERLEFEFFYPGNSKSITGKLTGKFGSGVYRPRKSGYMDMEPDFEDYLDAFNLKLHQELKVWLEK
ncbi:MAG: hypothetical protein ACKV1O_27390 [Saprospiraceae bacterium]